MHEKISTCAPDASEYVYLLQYLNNLFISGDDDDKKSSAGVTVVIICLASIVILLFGYIFFRRREHDPHLISAEFLSQMA
jgi:drug/metabolite transporter (DMT)-like permease